MTTEATSPGVVQAVVAAVLLIGVLALYLLRFARSWRWVAIALLVCVLDQAAKAVIAPGLQHRRISLLGGWLQMSYSQNWEQGFGGNVSHLLLMTAVCVAALYFLYERLLRARYRMSPLAEAAVALMVGGYAGILLDRVRLGFVVDFLEFGPASAFVYNIADLAVFLALALLTARLGQYLHQVWLRRSRVRDRAVGWPRS
ncbi:MAG TPA: signal peptidase II [Armatimonadota bacterium]|nr:signal peptidase II [Armatimonadota bacterium]